MSDTTISGDQPSTEEMLSSVAHDLKQPLGIMIGYTDLLLEQRSSFSEDEITGMLTEIRLAADRMARLIRTLAPTDDQASGEDA